MNGDLGGDLGGGFLGAPGPLRGGGDGRARSLSPAVSRSRLGVPTAHAARRRSTSPRRARSATDFFNNAAGRAAFSGGPSRASVQMKAEIAVLNDSIEALSTPRGTPPSGRSSCRTPGSEGRRRPHTDDDDDDDGRWSCWAGLLACLGGGRQPAAAAGRQPWAAPQPEREDGGGGRPHCLSTTALLTFFALLIGSKQTFGEPLSCMLPPQYPGAWNKYVHQFCYVSGTFHTNSGSYIDHLNPRQSLDYYQWVPYVLAVQAFFFYVPHLLWLCFIGICDVDFKMAVERCVEAQKKSNADRQLVIEDVAVRLFEAQRIGGPKSTMGTRATVFYLLSKILNLTNTLAQLILLNYFVGDRTFFWPVRIVIGAIWGDGWETTGFFPRISYCNFETLAMGNNMQKRVVQCVLMINMLSEKVYVIAYGWLFFLLLVTMLNLFLAVHDLFVASDFKKQLGRYCAEQVENHPDPKKFVDVFLNADGLLLLRFVWDHAGGLTASELAARLFGLFVVDTPLKEIRSYAGKSENNMNKTSDDSGIAHHETADQTMKNGHRLLPFGRGSNA